MMSDSQFDFNGDKDYNLEFEKTNDSDDEFLIKVRKKDDSDDDEIKTENGDDDLKEMSKTDNNDGEEKGNEYDNYENSFETDHDTASPEKKYDYSSDEESKKVEHDDKYDSESDHDNPLENSAPYANGHDSESESEDVSPKPKTRVKESRGSASKEKSQTKGNHVNSHNDRNSSRTSSSGDRRNDDKYQSSDDEREYSADDAYSVQSERSPPKKSTKIKAPPRNHSNPPMNKRGNYPKYGSIKPSPPKGRGRGKNAPSLRRNNDERSQVVTRVLSANRNKARALHNVIYELQQQIDTLTIENRDLKKAARLQDREIRRLDNAEAELPSLLKKHSSEMRTLQEKFKRQKESSDKSKETLKRREIELYKAKEKLAKYEKMVKEKNLAERTALNSKLHNLEESIEEKNKKISELTRAVQLHEKVRARELKEKNEKYKKAVEELKRLELEQKELLKRLKDKEKALEVTNIYSQRLHQRRGSKESDQTNFLFSPRDPVAPAIRRHQAEQEGEYAQSVKKTFLTEKDTVSSERNAEKMITMDFEGNHPPSPGSSSKEGTPRKEVYPSDSPRQRRETHRVEAPLRTAVSGSNGFDDGDFYGEQKLTEDEQRLLEIDRRIAEMKKREEVERVNEEQKKHDAEKELETRLKRLEEERMAKEKLERQRREEEDKYQSEQQKREEKQQSLEDQQRKAEEEFEKRKQEMYEKRKKKELLLAKMQAIDKGENPNEVTKPAQGTNESKQKKKPIFLESSNTPSPRTGDDDEQFDRPDSKKKNDGPGVRRGKQDDLLNENKERRNSWEFKQTDQNLHKGLPAHGDSPSIKRRNTKDSDELTSGSSSGRGSGRRVRNETVSISSGDKKGRRRADQITDNDVVTTSYSPTGIKPPNSTVKKKNDDLFGQFEDPFQSTKADKPAANQTKNQSQTQNTLVFSSDEDEGNDNTSYQPSQQPTRKFKGAERVTASRSSNTFKDDDLEEMILA